MTSSAATPDRRFRIGVNYWPAHTALRWWSSFDAGAVADDFRRLSSGGFDSVRIFLTWEAFQPTPDRVSVEMLDRLVVVADLAEANRLTIIPTLFTGHMSGVNLVPPWALGSTVPDQRFRVVAEGAVVQREIRNWYHDPDIAPAQALLAGRCAAVLAEHPAMWAWDLGNENSNCVVPGSNRSALDWLERVSTAIRAEDPTAAVTIGLHMEDLESDRHLGPAEAARWCDFVSMHGYPIYAPWAAGPTDDGLLGFLTEVTRWLSGGAEVLFGEFGLPTVPVGVEIDADTMMVTEQDAALYTDRALRTIFRAGACGAMLWCANDYEPSIWNEPPFDSAHHERHFGQWRSDGSPKPSVAAIAGHGLRDTDRPTAGFDHSWIDIEPDEFFTPGGSHLARLYARHRATHG